MTEYGVCDGAVGWNYFRLGGDYLHFAGMAFGLLVVLACRSAEGFSLKTQVLYQLVFVTRYLDLFVEDQVMYLVVFKIMFNLVTAATIVAMLRYRDPRDSAADSCSLCAIILGVGVLADVSTIGSSLRSQLWTFSEFLEPLALVPQYIVCYKAKELRPAVGAYIAAVGGYRVLYIGNWVLKRYCWHGAYSDYSSWLSGLMETVFFFDFMVSVARQRNADSLLGRFVVRVDEEVGKVSEAVEMRTFGKRLDLGSLSNTAADPEVQKLLALKPQADLGSRPAAEKLLLPR